MTILRTMILLDQKETFWTLLHDWPHWEFELFVGLVETIVIDFVVGFLIWKKMLKPYMAKKKTDIINNEHQIHGIAEEHE